MTAPTVYVVLIKEAKYNTVDVAKVFTKFEDAKAWVAHSQTVETSPRYGYRIDAVKLDDTFDSCY